MKKLGIIIATLMLLASVAFSEHYNFKWNEEYSANFSTFSDTITERWTTKKIHSYKDGTPYVSKKGHTYEFIDAYVISIIDIENDLEKQVLTENNYIITYRFRELVSDGSGYVTATEMFLLESNKVYVREWHVPSMEEGWE